MTEPTRIGHEFVGIVEEVGAEVRSVRRATSSSRRSCTRDNTCPHCRAGIQSRCDHGGFWGGPDRDGVMVDGGQGEYVRVPLADGTLVATREVPDDDLVPSLLSLSDVMGTGWHAAVAAQVQEGDTVVVVGDGAVGLCGVLAAARMGAERIVAMSRHAPRQRIAREFGATDVVEVRGDEAVAARQGAHRGGRRRLRAGVRRHPRVDVDSDRRGPARRDGGLCRCAARDRVPGARHVRAQRRDRRRDRAGAPVPARSCATTCCPGRINPGLVFDHEVPLAEVAEGYAAMDERRAIKSLVRP